MRQGATNTPDQQFTILEMKKKSKARLLKILSFLGVFRPDIT